MKSLELFGHLLQDCSKRCDAPIRRDLETVSRRFDHEGEGFLTITLPTFCQDFERSLDEGRLGPTLFRSFAKRRGRPAFLSAFLSKVFDDRGRLLDSPSLDCILSIRQLCLFFKKVCRPCSSARTAAAERKFVQCDIEVSNTPRGVLWDTFTRVADVVMSSVITEDWYECLNPHHGPGATAERILGNQKFLHRRWHERLEEVFPFTEFGLGSVRNFFDADTSVPDFIEPGAEQPVRVHFVPKTMKTPRVIAIEPVCMQYAQQAVSRWLVGRIESSRLTTGHVNFTDQTVNQRLALEGSRNGKYATIDLSEASDRVSLAMARAVYHICPSLWDLVDACRSRSALLPSGLVTHLNKFASMGSAMCFPTESMVFYLAIISSRLHRASRPVTARSVYTLSRDVYVFGDDLIVPSGEASAICADLETIGFKINSRKSFWTGKFRESCGMDCYDGVKVTPSYLRRDLPSDRTDVEAIVSATATANQLFDAGFCGTSMYIRKCIEQLVGKLPVVPRQSAAIGWFDFSDVKPPTRWNPHLQRLEMRCWVTSPKRRPDPLGGDGAMVKCFGLIGSEDPVDLKHLSMSVARGAPTLSLRWVPTY